MNKSRRILITNTYKIKPFYGKFLIILYIKFAKYNATFGNNQKLTMHQTLKKNWGASRYFILSGFIIFFLLLLIVVYKSNDEIIKKAGTKKNSYEVSDLKTIKKFLLGKIKSPFTNINYEIKKGDTIQKILKKHKVQNNEIQTIINQYKKYSNPNKLLAGNKIDIITEENPSTKKKFYTKIFRPHY